MDYKAYLENPELLHEGVEENRAFYIPYFAHKPADVRHRLDSDRVTVLSGDWDFCWFENAAAFEASRQGEVAMQRVTVPSVWQTYGCDTHQYTNVRYPSPTTRPLCPTTTPAACTSATSRCASARAVPIT